MNDTNPNTPDVDERDEKSYAFQMISSIGRASRSIAIEANRLGRPDLAPVLCESLGTAADTIRRLDLEDDRDGIVPLTKAMGQTAFNLALGDGDPDEGSADLDNAMEFSAEIQSFMSCVVSDDHPASCLMEFLDRVGDFRADEFEDEDEDK